MGHGPHSSKFLCCFVYCLCVNVYCTTATGWIPHCSQQIYHIIYHIMSYHILLSLSETERGRSCVQSLSNLSARLHGITFHKKNVIFIFNANRTSNLKNLDTSEKRYHAVPCGKQVRSFGWASCLHLQCFGPQGTEAARKNVCTLYSYG